MRLASRDIFCLVLRVLFDPLSGGHSEEVPPVPIPNTVVKLLSVEDTWRATARENRTLPEQSNGRSSLTSSVMYIFSKNEKTKTTYSSLAQSVERMTVNHDVAGSSPARGAKKTLKLCGFEVFYFFNISLWL